MPSRRWGTGTPRGPHECRESQGRKLTSGNYGSHTHFRPKQTCSLCDTGGGRGEAELAPGVRASRPPCPGSDTCQGGHIVWTCLEAVPNRAPGRSVSGHVPCGAQPMAVRARPMPGLGEKANPPFWVRTHAARPQRAEQDRRLKCSGSHQGL